MDCPKCSGELETRNFKELSVKRCNGCGGLMMRADMLEQMKDLETAEQIFDTGSPAIGKKYDNVDDIDCPECQIPMEKIWDPRQTHIWMESCPHCGMMFLDAGEFTDLKYETFSDLVKKLLKGARKG